MNEGVWWTSRLMFGFYLGVLLMIVIMGFFVDQVRDDYMLMPKDAFCYKEQQVSCVMKTNLSAYPNVVFEFEFEIGEEYDNISKEILNAFKE